MKEYKNVLTCILCLFGYLIGYTQHSSIIRAVLNSDNHTLEIRQEFTYQNSSPDTLSILYFNDWAHSFSDKTTPLGKRFSEEYIRRFYFAEPEERGYTDIDFIQTPEKKPITWTRVDQHPDIIGINLLSPLLPTASRKFVLRYTVKLPDDQFTRFGFTRDGNYNLRYWYINPVVYQNGWQFYSNKFLDDQFSALTDYQVQFIYPSEYTLTSELNVVSREKDNGHTEIWLEGKKRSQLPVYFEKAPTFYTIKDKHLTLISNLDDNEVMGRLKTVINERILDFISEHLGAYPYEKLLVSSLDYKENKIYGLNQLPKVIRPFPDGFQYEIKQLKTITLRFLENTLQVNPRKDAWVRDGILVYLMSEYIQRYYPNMKLVGNFNKVIGLRWFHIADLDFNDQYYLGYKNMQRLNLDQALAEPQDELLKFNKTIANPYKAGLGLRYLEAYEEDESVKKSIKEFYNTFRLKYATSKDFQATLTHNTTKDIQWFFDDFVAKNDKVDFKITDIKKKSDSLYVTIKNKRDVNMMPVPLSVYKDNKIDTTLWISRVGARKTIKLPNTNPDKLILNESQVVPEFNMRNNYQNLSGFFDKPLQFRFLQDVEDPRYSQLFLIPEFEFNNVYDGLIVGSTFYNRTLFRRPFRFQITPKYGFGSQRVLGSASFVYSHLRTQKKMNAITYGFSTSVSSYAPDLLVRSFTPSLRFSFRPLALRDNESQTLTFRSVNIFREIDPNDPPETPNYSVFNARYRYSNPNLIHLFSFIGDLQVAENFSKISAIWNYRKLFLNNRQLNLRLFAGSFLFNNTEADGDFFSYALDRPTDYLFDFNYLVRNESGDFLSQQWIPAEGGFKSQLDTPFANRWITTFNANTNIWNWVYAYGDVGLVKSSGQNTQFVYDSGIRLSLVADYFELFFPIYSNKGWEIGQPGYSNAIRFMITISPTTLIGLFTREWY